MIVHYINGSEPEYITPLSVTDNSVTVQLSDELSVRYGDLSDIYVAVGDSVAANALLGKYDQTFTATILQNGEAVTDVVASETEITWKI